MLPSLKIALSQMSCYSLAGEMGLNFIKKGNTPVSSCPCCGSTMEIHAESFICSNRSCDFGVGNAIDYLAYAYHNRKYEFAVKQFNELSEIKKGLLDDDNLIRETVWNRKLSLLFSNSEKSFASKKTALRTLSESWLRKQNIDISRINGTAYIWTSNEMDKLNKLLLEINETEISYQDNKCILAIPYYETFSSIGGVLIIREGIPKPIMKVFSNSKYLWAGLLQNNKKLEEYFVTQNFSYLLYALSNGKMYAPGVTGYLSVYYNSKGHTYGFIPDKVHYLYSRELDPIMNAPSSLHRDCTTFTIQHNRQPAGSVEREWIDFTIEEIIDRLSKGINGNELLYIDSCRFNSAESDKVLKALSYSLGIKVSEKLKKHFDTRVIVKTDKFNIHASPDGYFGVNTKTGEKIPISNFTLDCIKNVVYPHRKEISVEAYLNFSGNRIKINFPVTSVDIANKLEEYVRIAYISHPSLDTEGGIMPLVKEKSMYRKFISTYLKDCAANCASYEGVSFLGWSFNKKQIQGPGWTYTLDGIKHRKNLLHPDIDFITNYNCVAPIEDEVKFDDLNVYPKPIQDLVCKLTSNLMRTYLGLKPIATLIENTQNSREVCTQIFSIFGQTAIYRAPEIKNNHIEGCNGYPILVSDIDSYSARKCNTPIFLIGNTGMNLNFSFEENELKELKSKLSKVIFSVFSYIFTTEGKDFVTKRSSNPEQVSVEEGREIIKSACKLTLETTESTVGVFDEWLSKIPLGSIKDIFLLDVYNQQIWIDRQKVNSEELARDILSIFPGTVIESDYLKTKMVSVGPSLTSFYQTESIPYGMITAQ